MRRNAAAPESTWNPILPRKSKTKRTENGALPGGIGRNRGQTSPKWTPENERIICAYQIYGGRFDPKTLDAHLASIRDFEEFFGRKSLGLMRPGDIGHYRADLIERGRTGVISRSTLQHRASHLKAFFDWLVQQDGYRRMNKTTGSYFELPRSQSARAVQPKPRDFPTTEQVSLLLSSMPERTLIQCRDRAIVAVSFLFGTRAGATASLRLGHVDVEVRKVYQDATQVRVKNSKSQTTCWFPVGDPAERIVRDWVAAMKQLGCIAKDALFPPDAELESHGRLSNPNREAIEPWQSERAIRRAFRRGCESANLPYFNPHSARHYLASIRDTYCQTPEQRKAWSYNLGHEHEQTTQANYAKMTEQHRDEIFGNFSAGDVETVEELKLLLAFHEHELTRGTHEFERAEQLAEERRKRRKERSA